MHSKKIEAITFATLNILEEQLLLDIGENQMLRNGYNKLSF